MCTDGFLAIPTLKNRMTEVSALAIYFTLSNVISVVAPVLIEVITEGNVNVALWALAGAYIACAVVFAALSGISNIGRRRRTGRCGGKRLPCAGKGGKEAIRMPEAAFASNDAFLDAALRFVDRCLKGGAVPPGRGA